MSRLCKLCETGADSTELTDCQSNLSLISDKLQQCKLVLEAPPATTPVDNHVFTDLCKNQLQTQKDLFDQHKSILTDTIEELRREKQKLEVKIEKHEQNIAFLNGRLSMRSQNCEQTTTTTDFPEYGGVFKTG